MNNLLGDLSFTGPLLVDAAVGIAHAVMRFLIRTDQRPVDGSSK